TLNLALTFLPAFSGAKNVYMQATSPFNSTAFQAKGTWSFALQGPAIVGVTPSSGSGAQQTFAFRYSDTVGATDLSTLWVWFDNSSASSASASCLAFYYRQGNALYLLNSAGSAFVAVTLGAPATLSNTQCAIDVSASSVSTVSSTDVV